VLKNGGDVHKADDVFHEGIIALDKNIRANEFKGHADLKGYFYKICIFIWINKWKKDSNIQLTEIENTGSEYSPSPETIFIDNRQKELLNKVLELIDLPCRKILMLWKLSYSMEEISKACNLSSSQMAKKYRYRCMKKLLKLLDDHPSLLNDLQ
jgi:RNA polymerase sigma factor (sigma-70 family)